MNVALNTQSVDPKDLAKYEKMRNDKILYFKVLVADFLAEVYKILVAKTFTDIEEVISYRKSRTGNTPLLLIIPAIWMGGKDNGQKLKHYLRSLRRPD